MEKKTIKIGGTRFVFSELTVEDLTLIRNRIKKAKEAERKKIQDRQMATAEKLGDIDPLKLLEYLDKPVLDAEIDEGMDSLDSVAYGIYLGIAKKHPEITEEKIKQLLTPRELMIIGEEIIPSPEAPPNISVDMKILGYEVKLANGKTATINELIVEARKKKRTRTLIKKK